MTELYSVRPFVSHAGPDGNGVRAEVLVTKGIGTVVGIGKEYTSSAQININVPTLKLNDGIIAGWLNKYENYDDSKSVDEQTINPEYQLALDAIESGEPMEFRIEHQRRKKSKSDQSVISPETPIYELMGASPDGKGKQMNMVGDNTRKLLVGLGRPGEPMLFTQELTDPAEDPSSGGPVSARTSHGTTVPSTATAPTPQRHANGFNEVQPWVSQNPSGEINPGSYAVDAPIDFYFWLREYAEKYGVDGLNDKRYKILASHLVRLADDLQLSVYNDRLDEPDRNIGSYREAKTLIRKTVDTVIPLTTDDVSSQKSIQAWVDRVYDQSLSIWRWSIEDYASTIDASPYGDDVAPDDEDDE